MGASIILFIAFLSILLATPQGRDSFKSIRLYLGVFLGIVLLIPHIFWQYQHHFSEITYAMQRTETNAHLFLSRLRYPIYFLLSELGVIFGFLLLLIPFLKGKRISLSINRFQ